MKNTYMIKTVLLLTLLSGLFLMIGYALGGPAGMMMAFGMSLLMNIGSYWFSDKMVLAAHHAQELHAGDIVYDITKELCDKNSFFMPKVYLVPDRAPNAFATGRSPKHSAVAVTQGLLEILNESELRGVLAHEIGHIQNRDILTSTIVATIASSIMYIAHMAQWFGHSRHQDDHRSGPNPLVMILVVILAPFVTMLVQAAISRQREYDADETGAKISGDPNALADALAVISNPNHVRKFQDNSMSPDMNPAFSHLYIVNHFSTESVMSLFSTHPPATERIKRLRSLTLQ